MSTSRLLKFNYIDVQNFFSYTKARLTLNDKGLVLVTGKNKADGRSNGSGKSTLIAESLVWGLFGEIIRDIPVSKIPNRFNKGQCIVEIGFNLNGHDYVVKRTKRPDSVSYTVDGGTPVSLGDSRETTKEIIKILGMSFDEFVNSILFGQNIQKYFFLLTDAKQKDMLDNIINIGIIDQYKENAKKLYETAEQAKVKKEVQITDKTSSLSNSNVRLQDLLTKESQFIIDANKNIEYEISTLEDVVRNITDSINIKKQTLPIIDRDKYSTLKADELKIVDGLARIKSHIASLQDILGKKSTLPINNGILVTKSIITKSEQDLLEEKKGIEGTINALQSKRAGLTRIIETYNNLPISNGMLILSTVDNGETEEALMASKEVLSNDLISIQASIMADTMTLSSLADKIKDIVSHSNVDCPTCGRFIDDQHITNIKSMYESRILQIKENSAQVMAKLSSVKDTIAVIDMALIDRQNQKRYNELSGYIKELAEVDSLINSANIKLIEVTECLSDVANKTLYDKIIEAEAEVVKYSDMQTVLVKRLEDIRNEVKSIDDSIAVHTQISNEIISLESEALVTKRRVEALLISLKQPKDNPYSELINKENENILQAKKDIEILNTEITNISMLQDACKYWQQAYGDKNGVKSYIYKKVFPYLNMRCNHYLKFLSNGSIVASMSLDDKDRLVVDTINSEGADVYKGNSGGERRKIDLAIMFALHDLVASRKHKSNILILDEIFDNLDQNAIDSAVSLLEDMESHYDSIFVISHSDMKEYFDSHIYIMKDKTTSYVVEGGLDEAKA